MTTAAIKDLVAQMAERRQAYQANFRTFQRSAFLFRTGLQNISGKLAQTSEQFYALTGQDQLDKPVMVLKKAS